MHLTRLILGGSAIVAMIAMAGCDSQPSPQAPTTTAAPAASSTASAATTTDTAAIDAATAKACVDIQKEIKDNAGRVAKAEKIGPPAGHFAVSAQWAAGSASITASSIGANETVSTAADKVQKEMLDLSDAYSSSADAKPSKKKLDAAIKELDTACSPA